MNRKPRIIPVGPGIVMSFDGHDLWMIVNGVKVAKRGQPNTLEAGTWISLDPGFESHGDDWNYSDGRTWQ